MIWFSWTNMSTHHVLQWGSRWHHSPRTSLRSPRSHSWWSSCLSQSIRTNAPPRLNIDGRIQNIAEWTHHILVKVVCESSIGIKPATITMMQPEPFCTNVSCCSWTTRGSSWDRLPLTEDSQQLQVLVSCYLADLHPKISHKDRFLTYNFQLV